MNLSSIIAVMNKIAPPQYACSWDTNIGLQIGNKKQPINKILVTLDIATITVAAALKAKANLIIAHHALFFKDLHTIDQSKPLGNIIETLIKNDIAVFVAHTNLDAAPDGVNWTLARSLGLDPETCEVLEPTYSEELVKYVVFVPREHADKVVEALDSVDAGHIGNYSACTFQTEGTGTFQPEPGTKPFIGTEGKLQHVKEIRLETIIPAHKIGDVLNAVRKVHPYEEIAYDLYPLRNKGKTYGLGLVGKTSKPLTLGKKTFKTIAVCGGSGGGLIRKAYDKGAEAFVLGECTYHEQLHAEELGLPLLVKGHRETENLVIPVLKKKLKAFLPTVDIL
jgi:dinuclear metal center YbgI/SA1388 family protein